MMGLEYIGSFVCHQAPERTIQIGGRLLPLCSRCTGIYAGFLLGILYQLFFWRTNLKTIPSFKISFLCLALLGALIIDSIGSYLKLWSLSNETRLILGLLGGSSISLFLFPVFNYSFFSDSKRDRSVTKLIEYAGLLLVLGLFYLLSFTDNSVAYFVFTIFSIFGIVLLYLILNATISARIAGWKNRKNNNWRNYLGLSGIALVLTIVEIYFLYKRHLQI